ncbi:MAG: methylmalonyl Co-A mutase-associated GTPase MeaB [Flavobacteriales bacterium]|nr:methylmalonyl Co-A mutase-associated GTPase MeaB [Flavobacteriales bacterium]
MSHDPTKASRDLLLKGDRGALARAITLIESLATAQQQQGRDLIDSLPPATEDGLRIGITGIPGVGKSTLIDALGMHLIGQGHRVAVLAVDPSSARSGGSILGDKTRMDRLAVNDAAFIRPTATGGTLGGVARCTREAILLCEAAGYDRVVIETVGVGQNELAVDRMTDINILLMIAGAGDELQGIKRGIMETADVVVLNKCDSPSNNACMNARSDLQHAIQLLPARANGRHPKVLLCSALEGNGIPELAEHIHQLAALDKSSGAFTERRKSQQLDRVSSAVEQQLLEAFSRDERLLELRSALDQKVLTGELSPNRAAEQLIAHFRTTGAPPRE